MRKMFTKPSPTEIAAIELEQAERELLAAHTNAEYWDSQILYHTTRVERLKNYLGSDNTCMEVGAH